MNPISLQPNEIRAHANALQELIEDEIDLVHQQLLGAARDISGDMFWLKQCTEKIELLCKHAQALEVIERDAVDVLVNTLGWSSDETEVTPSGLRTLWVQVTEGMLNNQLLTLTDAKRRQLVEIGEKFKIRLPDGKEFETELCEPGNKLRERGMIRRFYEQAGVEGGDKVILKEIEKGSWLLLTLDSPEGRAELERKNPGWEAKKAALWAKAMAAQKSKEEGAKNEHTTS